MMKATTLIAVSALLLCGCKLSHKKTAPHDADAYRAKMELVVQDAIRAATDPQDKAAFQSGEIFANLKGLDLSLVGVSVPLDNEGRRAHLSYTPDYFEAKPPETLAQDALNDLARARRQ